MIEAFVIAFVLSIGFIRILIPAAVSVGFVDAPCLRKRHDGQIPLVGGLGIYATLLPLCLILPFWQARNGMWLIALGLPLLLTGLADDRWQLSARMRIFVEIGCSLAAIQYFGIRLEDIGHLLPQVGGTLVLLSVPLSVIGMVGVINAINMTDGVDGLAGGLSA